MNALYAYNPAFSHYRAKYPSFTRDVSIYTTSLGSIASVILKVEAMSKIIKPIR
jgi:hypothetical protein